MVSDPLSSQQRSTTGGSSLVEVARAIEAPIVRPWGGDIPPVIERAEGSHLWDVDGTRYLDLSGSLAATIVGHGHPRVVARVQEQAPRLMHCPPDRLSVVRVELLEQLRSLAPKGLTRVALAVTGSDANELAVRLALAATGRGDIVAFAGGYHGNGGLARALSSRRQPADRTELTLGFRIHHLPYPDPFRPPFGVDAETVGSRCLDHLADRVDDPYSGLGLPAAVIVEAVLGSGGIVVPPRTFLASLAAWCRAHGVLLIVDEVQTGFGRTGATWSIEHSQVVPDLLTFGKGIGGGLAVAGVLGESELMGALPPRSHSTTFLTNALNLAAASAAIDVFRDEELAERSRRLGERLLHEAEDVLGARPEVGEVRGLGLMVGIELVSDRRTREPAPELAVEVVEACRSRGILVAASGRWRNVLKLTPPLVIDEQDLLDAISSIGSVLAERAR